MENTSSFNADNFVNYLLIEGDHVYCDDTTKLFNQVEKLPKFYDKNKFKRGQKFYHDNIMAMFFGKLLGLIINLAIPKTVQILKLTKMSETPLTAYRRYLSTVFHMCVWYDADFYPGSQLWKSIEAVKIKHNNASRKGCCAGFGQLTQKDMALAQFGFMGFIVVRSEAIGVHNASESEMDAFVHLWRVLGYLFGIEDKYNLCRESLSETRQICNSVLTHILRPEMERLDPGFLDLSRALVTGMWAMNPVLNPSVFLAYIERILDDYSNNVTDKGDDRSVTVEKQQSICPDKGKLTTCHHRAVSYLRRDNVLIELSFWRRLHLYFVLLVIYSLKFTLIRVLLNWHHYWSLWLMQNFPFLAYKQYGKENSHVQIFKSDFQIFD